MVNNRTVHRSSGRRRRGPKLRFNVWVLVTIFAVTFAATFVVYMLAANIDDDFFDERKKRLALHSASNVQTTEAVNSEEDVQEENIQINLPVPQSDAADVSYLNDCCLVTDSTLVGMAGTRLTDILGGEGLTTAGASTFKINSSYGQETVYETMKLKKPKNLYIMLGGDLGASSPDDMMSAYMTLVSNVKNALPETKIYVMQFPPAYGDVQRNVEINDYNTQLLSMAKSLGVYCIDTNTEFKGNDGCLKPEYFDAATGGFSGAFYSGIEGYILTHTAK